MNLNTPRKILLTCYALALTGLCTVHVPIKVVGQQWIRDHMSQIRRPNADFWGPLWSHYKDESLVFTPDVAKLVIALFALTVFAALMFVLLGSLKLPVFTGLRKLWGVPNWLRKRENRQTLYTLLAVAAIIAAFGLASYR